MSCDQFAIHIAFKTREAKKRQIASHAKGHETKRKRRQGEDVSVKPKFSHDRKKKEQAYKDSLPFDSAAIVQNADLRLEIEANGEPNEFASPSMMKCIALDLGVRNLCGYAIEYIHASLPVLPIEPYDYDNGDEGIVPRADPYLVQESGVISTRTVYQETGITSRNYNLRKRVEKFINFNEEFCDEQDELKDKSKKTVRQQKLVAAARTHEICLFGQTGRCYSTPESSRTKFKNRNNMKVYFKKLFQKLISRDDMFQENFYPQENSNFVFIGGKDTFGKGLSKKLKNAIEIENKAIAIANDISLEQSKKRLQFHNENEFRTSSICP